MSPESKPEFIISSATKEELYTFLLDLQTRRKEAFARKQADTEKKKVEGVRVAKEKLSKNTLSGDLNDILDDLLKEE